MNLMIKQQQHQNYNRANSMQKKDLKNKPNQTPTF